MSASDINTTNHSMPCIAGRVAAQRAKAMPKPSRRIRSRLPRLGSITFHLPDKLIQGAVNTDIRLNWMTGRGRGWQSPRGITRRGLACAMLGDHLVKQRHVVLGDSR